METIVDITEGNHLPWQFTGFTLVDGPLTYSIVQRGKDNIASKVLGALAFAADIVDFGITGSVAAAYTIEQLVTAAAGGPPGALAGLLAGDVGYKAVNLGLLGVDAFGLTMIASADIASGRSGIDLEAGQLWIGFDTLVSATTLSVSAASTVLPVAPGVYVSLGGDLAQMTYDFLRAFEVLPGYSFQVQW